MVTMFYGLHSAGQVWRPS